jgi:hypothetical protein
MDALEQQKINVMIEMATKKLRDEITELKGKVTTFEADISNMRSQISAARSNGFSQQQPQVQMQQQQVQQPQQQPTYQHPYAKFQAENVEEVKTPITQPIDRNGVAPAEVDIQKMFYMGHKKF